ncbi:unnamed protein product [Hyaloperonospora brassicae]|uniref:DDE-1 domain-containing protein n=1 Tax=Hyaloperonospora brassicae TaxID=162125 RepID=A0AAV0U996_HYABA|nr:unnamed protein product [Hyaloperonospora brassicae]
MNSAVFVRWLCHFSDAVPSAAQRPLILVHDGCSSHYNGEIVREESTIDVVMREYNLNGGEGYISRKTAIRLVSTAWTKAIVDNPANAVSGFRACGLWPVSLTQQQRRLKLFQDWRMRQGRRVALLAQVREVVQTEILVLLASSTHARKRCNTIYVNRRLFARWDF